MLRRTRTPWNPEEGAWWRRGRRWSTPPRLLSLSSFSSSASHDPADHGCSCSGPRRWHTGSGWMPCIAWCRRRSRCGKSRRRRPTCPGGRWRWQDSWSRSLPVCRMRPGTREGSCCSYAGGGRWRRRHTRRGYPQSPSRLPVPARCRLAPSLSWRILSPGHFFTAGWCGQGESAPSLWWWWSRQGFRVACRGGLVWRGWNPFFPGMVMLWAGGSTCYLEWHRQCHCPL